MVNLRFWEWGFEILGLQVNLGKYWITVSTYDKETGKVTVWRGF